MTKQLVLVATMTVTFWAASSQAQPPAGEKAAAPPAPAAAGAKPPAMEIPKPPPENDVIKKSAGNWRCTGMAKAPDGQEMKYTSTWTVKPLMGGHWYALTYKRAKAGPMPAFEGQGHIGFNTAEKKYSMVGFDNWGGWINLSSTDGATYSGQAADMGKSGSAKFSFSPGKDKKGEESDKLFDVTMEFPTGSSTESCKK